MNSFKKNRPNHMRMGLGWTLGVFFAAIALFASTIPVGSQTAQATFNIDLGASPSPANIKLLGANASDHLSGNGTPNSFTSFPRAHAIAISGYIDRHE